MSVPTCARDARHRFDLPATATSVVTQDAGGDSHAAVACSVQAVRQWLGRFDVVVVGPGLGRDPAVQSAVRQVGYLTATGIEPPECDVGYRV